MAGVELLAEANRKLIQMAPALPLAYPVRLPATDWIVCGDGGKRFSGRPPTPDFPRLCVGQIRKSASLSSPSIPPPLSVHVLRVVFRRAKEKVIGIYTRWVVASVKNEEARAYWTLVKLVGNPRDDEVIAAVPDLAVASTIGAAGPKPTATVCVELDVSQQALDGGGSIIHRPKWCAYWSVASQSLVVRTAKAPGYRIAAAVINRTLRHAHMLLCSDMTDNTAPAKAPPQ